MNEVMRLIGDENHEQVWRTRHKDETKNVHDPTATVDKYLAAADARDSAIKNLIDAATAALDARHTRDLAYAALDDPTTRGDAIANIARGNLAVLIAHGAAANAETDAQTAGAIARSVAAAAAAAAANDNCAAVAKIDADGAASAAETARRAATGAAAAAADRLSNDTLRCIIQNIYAYLGIFGNKRSDGIATDVAHGLYGLNDFDYNLDDFTAACNALDNASDDDAVNLAIAFDRDGEIVD
ncbi:unnamed protein product [Adineta steineri]|uniref:Uncharacterized protein n=1 Tax=Adineta steineri TaxID=433720 RepID=A0A815NFY1_9BILA|nr:unnamed protein product [Adineta steineri]CAF1437022.1 unnamed protein product [Adineta steineri]CAF1626293.1 unnamed protein product [Adineta steineri]